MRGVTALVLVLAAACSEVRVVDDDGPPGSGSIASSGGEASTGGMGQGGVDAPPLECVAGELQLAGDVVLTPMAPGVEADGYPVLAALPEGRVLFGVRANTPDSEFPQYPALLELSPWETWPQAIDAPAPIPFRSQGFFVLGEQPGGAFLVTSTGDGPVLLDALPGDVATGVQVGDLPMTPVLFAAQSSGNYLVRTKGFGGGSVVTSTWPDGTTEILERPCSGDFDFDAAVSVSLFAFLVVSHVIPEGENGCAYEDSFFEVSRYEESDPGVWSRTVVQTIPTNGEYMNASLVPRDGGAWLITDLAASSSALKLDEAGVSLGPPVEIPVGSLSAADPVGPGFAVMRFTDNQQMSIEVFDGDAASKSFALLDAPLYLTGRSHLVASPDLESLFASIWAQESDGRYRTLLARLDCVGW